MGTAERGFPSPERSAFSSRHQQRPQRPSLEGTRSATGGGSSGARSPRVPIGTRRPATKCTWSRRAGESVISIISIAAPTTYGQIVEIEPTDALFIAGRVRDVVGRTLTLVEGADGLVRRRDVAGGKRGRTRDVGQRSGRGRVRLDAGLRIHPGIRQPVIAERHGRRHDADAGQGRGDRPGLLCQRRVRNVDVPRAVTVGPSRRHFERGEEHR